MSTRAPASDLPSRQPERPSLLCQLPVELRLAICDLLDLDALVQLRRSGHAGLGFCQLRGHRAYRISLSNMFGLNRDDINTLSSVLRIASLMVQLADKTQSREFAEAVSNPRSSEAILTNLLTSGGTFSRLHRGTLPTLRSLASQFERAEAAFARTSYERWASELPTALRSRFVAGLARYLVASVLHHRRSNREEVHSFIQEDQLQERFDFHATWIDQYSAQQVLDILSIVRWFDAQTNPPDQDRYGDILLRIGLGVWLDVYEDRNVDFTCLLRDLDLYILPVLEYDLASWFVEREVVQDGVDIRELDVAQIQAIGLEPMPVLGIEHCYVCNSPEDTSHRLWNAHNAQFMQRQHGFAPLLILPLKLRTSLYLQTWVTYYLEDPNRDNYAHLLARHPRLVVQSTTSGSTNGNLLASESTKKQRRPQIGQIPAFRTVGLSIGALLQDLADLPAVITNPRILAEMSQDEFANKTNNKPLFDINNNFICSGCASELLGARFWVHVRHRMQSGLVPGYDPGRRWCRWGVECQAMNPRYHLQSHFRHAMLFEHFSPRMTPRLNAGGA